MRFHIHYTEKGDGKRMPSGIIYNGKRHIYLSGNDREAAIRKLRRMYVPDGIKEITKVDEAPTN